MYMLGCQVVHASAWCQVKGHLVQAAACITLLGPSAECMVQGLVVWRVVQLEVMPHLLGAGRRLVEALGLALALV
jgi:hypothetical protein